MKDHLLIIGASGHGRVVADIAQSMKRWQSISFLDDDDRLTTSMGIEVIGKCDEVDKYLDHCDVVVAIGNNEIREKIQEMLIAKGASIPVLIHPSAVISDKVQLGAGTVVMAGAIINCCTKIGCGCIINTGSSIDHDNIIEDYVHISPGVHTAGTVRIGKGTWLGIGSVISNNISITDWCKVGAGAVVIKNITETGTYIGVPARRI